MTHPPKKLALLISLIGAGVSPYALARTEVRVVGVAASALDSVLTEPAATALDRTRWSPGLVWRTEEGTAGVALPLRSADEDRGPGEAPSGLAPLADAPLQAQVSQPAAAIADEPKPKAPGRLHKLRALVQVFATKRQPAPGITPIDAAAMARSARLPMPSAGVEAAALASLDAAPAPSHTDRLLQSLAAILMDDVSALDCEVALSTLADRFPAALVLAPAVDSPAPSAGQAQPIVAPAAQRIERREIVVAPQSSKVLGTLEAILSSERDEVGAIRNQASESIVSTQAGKVLATLENVAAAQRVVEDGAARRARKHAAIRARAQAVAAAAVVESARHATLQLDIDLTQPPVRQSRRSPLGGERLAINEQTLDGVRGGFVADGLNISFGIERAVYINGSLVTTTSLNISELGRLSAGRGSVALDAGTIGLIQSGSGNSVSTGNALAPACDRSPESAKP